MLASWSRYDYEELPAVADPEIALDAETPVIHASLGDNLCFERKLDVGPSTRPSPKPMRLLRRPSKFGRHTGVTHRAESGRRGLERRRAALTVYHGTQAPHMMQDMFARHLGIPEHRCA